MNRPRTYVDRGLHGRVVHELGLRILRGQLAPGTTLRTEELEREFDVSRTVIREALKVLGAKGLVDARPRRGTYVRPRADWILLDPDVLRWQFEGRSDSSFFDNLAEVRAIIEPAGAWLAAKRRTEADLERLERALDQMVAAGRDGHAFMVADLEFHRALLAATHNEQLERMEGVIEAGLWARNLLVHQRQDWPSSTPAHRRVFEAVRDEDKEGAAAAVESLLAQAARDLERLSPRVDVARPVAGDPGA
jgi:GntR family transcriptional regulator, galactonate operon transcriptional repressor